MASPSLSRQQNPEFNAFSGIEPAGERRKVCQSSTVYDVFINHRGPDVKHTLATRLYNSLDQLGIRAFLDSEEKELGISFTSTIESAILSAQAHIAIFSQSYAESPWCLAELVLMLQSTAKIIPLFYQVKPSDLRYIEKGAYAEAFIKYKDKGRYLDKLNAWKEALQSLSFVAGEEVTSEWDCQKIIAAVQKEIERKTCLHVAEYPVGLNTLVEDFERRCLDELVQDFENHCRHEEGKHHEAKVVGIFGMGGSGKTTLAKELFNRKKSNYTTASFLFDVREASVKSRSDLPSLQSKLLKDLFGKEISFRTTEDGTSSLKDHLSRAPILSSLIVVDDIDHVDQLNFLRVMDFLNKPGNSLVIVTTRDVGVFITAGITVCYNLRGMDRNDARELFCWHAFRQAHPCSGYNVLVDSFVDVCCGLPLSLQVLGRHVHGRDHRFWESELIKARKTLPQDVKERLKISFDALDDEEKQVFMDIACFLEGNERSIAERVLGASGWNAHNAIERLKDKCLLEKDVFSSEDNGFVLRMHDHLMDLGREMARELSPPHRVWNRQELKSLELKGFKFILNIPDVRCLHSIFDESMGCKVSFFLAQANNRFETSGSLLWLQLEGNSTEQPSIPSWIPLQNLQYLNIYSVQFKTLWTNDIQSCKYLQRVAGSSDLMELRELVINECPELEELPSLSGLNKMEKLVIYGCGKVQNITLPTTLIKLDIQNCRKLQRVAGSSDLMELRDLVFNECPELEELPSLSGVNKMEMFAIYGCGKVQNITLPTTLIKLDIQSCRNLQRVGGTSDFMELRELIISECPELEELPSFSRVNTMEKFGIYCCGKIIKLDILSCLVELRELTIIECPELEELPSLCRVNNMEEFVIYRCGKVQNITLPMTLFKLDIRYCKDLQRVVGTGDLMELRELMIFECPELEELPSLSKVNNMEIFVIRDCGKVQKITLPMTIINFEMLNCRDLQGVFGTSDLIELRELVIRECPELEELPSLSRVNKMDKFVIYYCGKVHNIMLPTTLIKLDIRNCIDLQRVAETSDLIELRELMIFECPALEELPSLSRVNSIENFVIHHCGKVQNIMLPTTLMKLDIKGCRNLQRVAGTNDLMELRELIISECPELEELLSLSRVNNMEKFGIYCCGKIIKLDILNCLVELRELIISECPELEELPSLCRVNNMEEFAIYGCGKVHNIMLPTTLIKLDIRNCKDLQRVAGTNDLMELRELIISECPELEELPSLCRVNNMEKFVIYGCGKVHNIMLPTTLIKLDIRNCKDLQRVAGTGDLMELRELIIIECPEIGEWPSLSRLRNLENIVIVSCEKIQNIMLPTTLIKLNIQSCRNLQRVVETSDLMELRELIIIDCPKLEDLPSLSRVNNMENFVIDHCGKLQNTPEKLHASKYMRLCYCSNAIIRDSIQKLKSVPSKGMDMIGRAVNGAESSLNQYLFSEANIGIEEVIEITSTHEPHPDLAEMGAVILCFVVVVESSTSTEDINKKIRVYGYNFKVRQGESIITIVDCDDSRTFASQGVSNILRDYGILKKGYRVALKEGEQLKSLGVLGIIIDRLHHP